MHPITLTTPVCSYPEIPTLINYITYLIPILLVVSVLIYLIRTPILEQIISKPSYEIALIYAFNGVYGLTAAVAIGLLAIFLAAPILLPPEWATCASPLA